MKKCFLLCCVGIFCSLFAFAPAALAAPDFSGAEGAMLMEVDTQRVLACENPDEQLPMASTTKIMTAILAIEKGDLSDTVTVSENAAGVEGSSIWLSEGEHLTLEDLLYGLMLSSGNDAAVAIAEHIGGSVEEFVADMNAKAQELGALNTHFVTPNGLHDSEHYTTARDLALITVYAMKNDTFRTIVSTEYKEIPWEVHEYSRVLRNKNRNLWQYDGATGVKTGYTTDAGRCYVGSAKREGMEVVCVLLNDYDMFADSREIMDYAFTNYQNVHIVSKDDIIGRVTVENGIGKSVRLKTSKDFVYPCSADEQTAIQKEIVLPKTVQAPVKSGEALGKMNVSIDGVLLASIPLIADDSVAENTYTYNLNRVLSEYLFV